MLFIGLYISLAFQFIFAKRKNRFQYIVIGANDTLEAFGPSKPYLLDY